MKLDRSSLRKILIAEACGCMGVDVEPELEYYEADYGMDEIPETSSPGSIDRDSALNSVAVLAMAVDCPVTREALLSVVHELM